MEPKPSTSAEGDFQISIQVHTESESFEAVSLSMVSLSVKNGTKIEKIVPAIRKYFRIQSNQQIVLYKAGDEKKEKLDDEYVLKDMDSLCYSIITSSDSSDSDGTHTSADADTMTADSSSNEEKKRLLVDEERWLQQYFEKKFGLTKRF